MSLLAKLKQRSRALKGDTIALYLAVRHPATPWYAKGFAALVVAYALSPIDLIPDFVPILGYLDDLILIPLGLSLVLRMIPDWVMAECRSQAVAITKKPVNWVTGAIFILLWLVLATWAAWWCYGYWQAAD